MPGGVERMCGGWWRKDQAATRNGRWDPDHALPQALTCRHLLGVVSGAQPQPLTGTPSPPPLPSGALTCGHILGDAHGAKEPGAVCFIRQDVEEWLQKAGGSTRPSHGHAWKTGRG